MTSAFLKSLTLLHVCHTTLCSQILSVVRSCSNDLMLTVILVKCLSCSSEVSAGTEKDQTSMYMIQHSLQRRTITMTIRRIVTLRYHSCPISRLVTGESCYHDNMEDCHLRYVKVSYRGIVALAEVPLVSYIKVSYRGELLP